MDGLWHSERFPHGREIMRAQPSEEAPQTLVRFRILGSALGQAGSYRLSRLV